MVSFMHDHVGKHGGPRRPRPGTAGPMDVFNPTRCAIQRFAEHPYTSLCTFRQRPPRLFLGTAGAVELSRQLDVRGGEPEPFAPDVMHMREDRDNRAGVAAGRLGSPGL